MPAPVVYDAIAVVVECIADFGFGGPRFGGATRTGAICIANHFARSSADTKTLLAWSREIGPGLCRPTRKANRDVVNVEAFTGHLRIARVGECVRRRSRLRQRQALIWSVACRGQRINGGQVSIDCGVCRPLSDHCDALVSAVMSHPQKVFIRFHQRNSSKVHSDGRTVLVEGCIDDTRAHSPVVGILELSLEIVHGDQSFRRRTSIELMLFDDIHTEALQRVVLCIPAPVEFHEVTEHIESLILNRQATIEFGRSWLKVPFTDVCRPVAIIVLAYVDAGLRKTIQLRGLQWSALGTIWSHIAIIERLINEVLVIVEHTLIEVDYRGAERSNSA